MKCLNNNHPLFNQDTIVRSHNYQDFELFKKLLQDEGYRMFQTQYTHDIPFIFVYPKKMEYRVIDPIYRGRLLNCTMPTIDSDTILLEINYAILAANRPLGTVERLKEAQ